MCKPASFVLTKENVYWSLKSDSHENILAEHYLREKIGENINILRVEISPSDGDIFSPTDRWEFSYDQDIMPEWADADRDERRARAALKDWASARVFDGVEDLEIRDGRSVFMRNSSAKLYGSSRAKLYGSSRANLFGSSSATLYGSSSAKLYGSSRAYLFGLSSAKLYGSSSATLFGSSSAQRITKESCAVSQSDLGVVIDRSVTPPKCHVGKE